MNSSPPLIPVRAAPLEYDLPNFAAAIAAGGAVKIVALGSSTMSGEGGIAAFPYRLEAALRDGYDNRRIDVVNRGIGGEEAPKELERLQRDVIDEQPSLLIWQMGTNSVWQKPEDHPPSHEQTIAALRKGIKRVRDKGSIDIILMDPQYVPAMLTLATRDATERMVLAIAEVSRQDRINLFRRFALMKGWHDVEKIPFDRMVDPGDPDRLHDSDWATQKLTTVLRDLVVARVPKPVPAKAFVIAAETVKDEATFSEYRQVVPATLGAFGGKFTVRGGHLETLEGKWPHPRLVIIEFPSRAAAEGWYRSPQYQEIIGLRLKSSVGELVIVEGQVD
jgi:uncharacterized protein (DUF1330 family)/lysophospholipase L1-like esterase